MKSNPRIALIGCGKQKASMTCPAQLMYRSPLFRSAVRYATATCDRFYVLSAKHGLLDPDKVIEPYDLSMSALTKTERLSWAMRVWRSLNAAVPFPAERDAEIIFLAGEKCSSALGVEPPPAGKALWMDREFTWEEPLKGMGIGERIAWLKEHARVR